MTIRCHHGKHSPTRHDPPATTAPLPELLTKREVAAALRVCEETAARMMRAQELPSVVLKRRRLVRREDFLAFRAGLTA